MSSSLSFFMSFGRWVRMPRMSSSIDSLKEAVTEVSEKISAPSLGSAMPKRNFYFLEDLVAGRFWVRKFFRVSGTLF
jgi:hypothetical protein